MKYLLPIIFYLIISLDDYSDSSVELNYILNPQTVKGLLSEYSDKNLRNETDASNEIIQSGLIYSLTSDASINPYKRNYLSEDSGSYEIRYIYEYLGLDEAEIKSLISEKVKFYY